MLFNYYQVDELGKIIDVRAFSEDDEIPEGFYRGWRPRSFISPIYDKNLGDWVEGLSTAEIITPQIPDKVAALSNECEEVIKAGFDHNGDFFAFQDKDQTNFNQQLSLMIVDPLIATTFWKTENNGIKQFTRDQFIEICKTAERHKRDHIGKFWQLRNYVETHEFTSVDEFNAVSYETWVPGA